MWTGIEYQVATHLVYEGLVDEGLDVVRAVRDRHDGLRRNPWNEVECGNHYARSLASWGLLLALSGADYDARAARLSFAPARRGPPLELLHHRHRLGACSQIDDGPYLLHLDGGASRSRRAAPRRSTLASRLRLDAPPGSRPRPDTTFCAASITSTNGGSMTDTPLSGACSSATRRRRAQTAYLSPAATCADSANIAGWPTQAQLEADFTAAFGELGWAVHRANAVDPATGHGFISSQRMGIEVFKGIPSTRR